MTHRIVGEKEKSPQPVKLTETIPFLNQEEGLIIKEYQKKLSRLRTAIVTANHINQQFTSDTLGYLNDAVSLICRGIVCDPLYNTSRKEQMGKNTPALVSREV